MLGSIVTNNLPPPLTRETFSSNLHNVIGLSDVSRFIEDVAIWINESQRVVSSISVEVDLLRVEGALLAIMIESVEVKRACELATGEVVWLKQPA
jgi:hypothetical protein